MSKRNDILNYLVHVLSQIGANNNASASAQLSNTRVDTLSVSISGLFYRGAHVSIDSPGAVSANGIASLSGDSVDSIVIDIPGGVYSNTFVALLSELGFTLHTQSGDVLGFGERYIPAITLVGDGSGANAYAVTNAAGSVTSVVVDAGGSGYSVPPQVIFEAPNESLQAARASANIRRGLIESIDVSYGSHSYTAIPTVTISASTLQFNTAVSQSYRSYRYLEDVNDFPTVCLGGTPSEEYFHYGDGQIIKTMQQFIRGYVRTTEEDSIDSSEALARDIEAVIDEFAYLSSNLSVQSAQVTQISTDEGLLSPYGVCDVVVEIAWLDEAK